MATNQVQQSIEKPEPSPRSSQRAAPVKGSLERKDDGKTRFRGCSSIKCYETSEKLGEGTFGEVYKARSLKDGHAVALKKILMHNEKDGFPITALREIKLLKMLSHPNILKLEEMAVERTKGEGRKKAIMYMVTPYMDHDLSGLLENPSVQFSEPQIKCYMLQLLEGLRYLHASKILHRDMKAANLLINNHGILQIADFGLARPYDDPAPQPGKGGGEARRDYTTLVVTRWYRPPELLLQLRRYTTAIDMWGVGCVFGEMFKGKPILAGTTDLDQAHRIFELVGSPTEENMPGWGSLPGCDGVRSFQARSSKLGQVFRQHGPAAISLLSELLKLDWRKRINAIDALEHPYFKSHPLPARPGDIPRFEDSHELDRRKFRGQKATLPPAPAGGSVGMGANGEWANGPGPPAYTGPLRPPGRGPGFPGQQQQYGPPPPRRNEYSSRTIGSLARRRRHHHHHHTGQRGPGKQTVFPLDRLRAMLAVAEAFAGRTGHPLMGPGREFHQGVQHQEEPDRKSTLIFRVIAMTDLEAGTKVNEETREGKGAGTAIEGRPKLGSLDAGGVVALTCIASTIAKRTDGRFTSDQPGSRARTGGTRFILYVRGNKCSLGASNGANISLADKLCNQAR
ncbi:MAG: hypothetical protein LQ346_000234 [Caloplaca aetnensis]|nr:MAG: hypothetical protein LQ346_000234 [Caloplaca aetnensis]